MSHTPWYLSITSALLAYYFYSFNQDTIPSPIYTVNETLIHTTRVDVNGYCRGGLPSSSRWDQPGYQLKQVYIFTRHGDRTPLRGLPNEQVVWDECFEREIMSLTASNIEEYSGQFPSTSIAPNGPSRPFERVVDIPLNESDRRGYWGGNCNPGQLTTRGHRQMRVLGQHVRKVYLEQDHMWVDTMAPTPQHVYLRSTDVWRTIQSAQSFVSGLFPPETDSSIVIPLRVRPQNIDPLAVSLTHCPRLASILNDTEHLPEIKAFSQYRDSWNAWIQNMTSSDFTLDYHYDSFQARFCHEKELPCLGNECMTREKLVKTAQIMQWWFYYKYASHDLDILRTGPIFKEWVMALSNQPVKGFIPMPDTSFKLWIYSSHDTTLLSLLMALDVMEPPGSWPPYASHLIVEVVKRQADGQEFIRLVYNGEHKSIGWCQKQEQGLCPLNEFIQKATQFGDASSQCD